MAALIAEAAKAITQTATAKATSAQADAVVAVVTTSDNGGDGNIVIIYVNYSNNKVSTDKLSYRELMASVSIQEFLHYSALQYLQQLHYTLQCL